MATGRGLDGEGMVWVKGVRNVFLDGARTLCRARVQGVVARNVFVIPQQLLALARFQG